VSRRTSFHFAAAFSVAALAIALAFAVVAARPVQATPDKSIPCTSCHTGAATGSVTAVPSTTTPAPGTTYTVAINVGLGTSGRTGYHIANSDAAGATGTWTTAFAGGPNAASGQTSWTATMTAPATAGTYYYKVFGVKGYPGSATFATYSITVSGGTGGGTTDTVKPTTVAPSAASVIKGRKATLKYQVNDAAPNLGTASAVIKIKNSAGKVVKTLKPGAKAVNVLQKATFTCKLAKGKYKFYVTATDAAGNLSSNTAMNRLTVK
jgi:hypothetical protein